MLFELSYAEPGRFTVPIRGFVGSTDKGVVTIPGISYPITACLLVPGVSMFVICKHMKFYFLAAPFYSAVLSFNNQIIIGSSPVKLLNKIIKANKLRPTYISTAYAVSIADYTRLGRPITDNRTLVLVTPYLVRNQAISRIDMPCD